MRFVTQREPLQQAISIVSRAVPSRSTKPVMNNILIEADADGLTLSATDHEIGIVAHVAVNTEEAGRTTLPAKSFGEYVGVQAAGLPLTIESDQDEHALFHCGGSEMMLSGMPADDYPPIPVLNADVEADGLDERGTPVVKSDAHFQVPGKTLKSLVDACIIAVSHDETRARMTGMLMTIENTRLRMVATDTHRLATESVPLADVPPAVVAAIIPARALEEVSKLAPDDDTPIDIDLTDSEVQFRLPAATISARLIDGEFPGYRRVIPSRSDWRVQLSREQFTECVQRCKAAVSREDNSKIKLVCQRAGELGVRSMSTTIGASDQTIRDVRVDTEEAVTAETLEISFNGAYLMDVLKALKSDDVILQFTGKGRPGVVRPADVESDYVYVLMPMQES